MERTLSVVALLALLAAGVLLAVTIVTPVQATAGGRSWSVAIMALAWVALLASALLAHRHRKTAQAGAPVPDAPGDAFATLRRDARDETASTAPPPSEAAAEAHAARADTPGPDPGNEPWRDDVLEFAQDALGALEADRLRLLIAGKVPALLGREDVWVVAGSGSPQQVFLPSRPDGSPSRAMLTEEPREWATFPLKAEGQTIGILGVGVTGRALGDHERPRMIAVAGVLGRALKSSAAFEAMREATLVDPLTGCGTRAEGLRRFEAELRRAERSKSALAVLMLDLDHFKSINDRYGHNAGDEVLTAVGGILLSTLRASDIRCRWGGEEFLVVLPDSTIDRATSAAEALRKRIAGAYATAGEHTVRVTASIGITMTRPGEVDIPKIFGRADAALYEAKRQGRNGIRVVLGDFKGQIVAAAPIPTSGRADGFNGQDRRHPSGHERRKSPGRRRTDAGILEGPWTGARNSGQ